MCLLRGWGRVFGLTTVENSRPFLVALCRSKRCRYWNKPFRWFPSTGKVAAVCDLCLSLDRSLPHRSAATTVMKMAAQHCHRGRARAPEKLISNLRSNASQRHGPTHKHARTHKYIRNWGEWVAHPLSDTHTHARTHVRHARGCLLLFCCWLSVDELPARIGFRFCGCGAGGLEGALFG